MSPANAPLMWFTVVLMVLAAATMLIAARRLPRRRRWLHAALLATASGALFLFLFPPATTRVLDGQLVVLTPGATQQQLARHVGSAKVIALPGVNVPAQVPSWPDLASALRHHHDAVLHVVGAGLPLRDRAAARGRVAWFDAAPLPDGIIELVAAQSLPAGRIWSVSGRSRGDVARLELHDPAGGVADQADVDGQGNFRLATALHVAGPALYSVQAFAADGVAVDQVPLGVDVLPGAGINMLVLAGAPDAELKYLRRWAVDSGLTFNAHTALAGDIALHEGDDSLDAERLASLDLLVVDERSWQGLSDAQRQTIDAAVRSGLGLLLRIAGPLDEATQGYWQELGIALTRRDRAAGATLDVAPDVPLPAQPWQLQHGAPLLRSSDGEALAAWQWHGAGRVGATWLDSAWPLVLAGNSAAFGSIWADIASTLARAHNNAELSFSFLPRAGEHAQVCGLPTADAQLIDRRGKTVMLLVDDRGCASFWPHEGGWHTININNMERYINVLDEHDARALKHAAAQLATQRLVVARRGASMQESLGSLSRWALFVIWLALLMPLWWLERQRRPSP